ncbi:MAG: chemotaxis protein CheW, partial [Proteobacteria bacterium]|nr:chemotaxis protein CheW [Pseudomonadota bacterium]
AEAETAAAEIEPESQFDDPLALLDLPPDEFPAAELEAEPEAAEIAPESQFDDPLALLDLPPDEFPAAETTAEAETVAAEIEPESQFDDPLALLDLPPDEFPAAEPEPEAETEAETAGPKSKIESDFLDELIASIDEELEQSLDSGDMANLPAEAPSRAGSEEQHVIFTLAGTEYAVSIANVTEISRPLNTTPVPNVPDWVHGVANLRGDIISMVDLRAFLGMKEKGYDLSSRMLLVRDVQEEMVAGLIVDRVNEIRYLPMDRVVAPTAPIEDQVAPYLRGVYEHDDHLLVILDFDKLLLSPEMQQFQTV